MNKMISDALRFTMLRPNKFKKHEKSIKTAKFKMWVMFGKKVESEKVPCKKNKNKKKTPLPPKKNFEWIQNIILFK